MYEIKLKKKNNQIKLRKLHNINKNALKELTQSAILSCLDGKQILSGAVFGRLKS